ncbi:MAG TPA: ribonuclease III [Bacilli bacterium]|nr:ribonuclease III [Bacilli bacterium]
MKILEDFNIHTNNIKIYEWAFCHSSYYNENNINYDYERLEFLGDKVLDLIVSTYLYKTTKYEEGKMTKIRANYVCENALYEYALELKLYDYIMVGKGEESSGGKMKKTILADTFEAFLGAVYIDQGISKVEEIINKVVIPLIKKNSDNFLKDYKSELQEYVQTSRKSVVYDVINEEGPSHDRTFTVTVKVDDIVLGTGKAKSKKEAEQEAAKAALDKQARN